MLAVSWRASACSAHDAETTGWPNSPVPTYSVLCPESAMNANTDAPWWRHWSIWVALALATLAIFLPVLR